MDDALGVSGVQGIGDLDRQFQKQLQFHRPTCDLMFQGYAVEKLHGDEGQGGDEL